MDITKIDEFKKQLDTPVVKPKVQESIILSETEKEFNDDYQFTKKKLKSLIKTGEEAVEQLMNIARETNEPGAYKIVGDLIGKLGDLTTNVGRNAKVKSDIDLNVKEVNTDNTKIVNHNKAIFVGNHHELLELIKNEANKDIIEVINEDDKE